MAFLIIGKVFRKKVLLHIHPSHFHEYLIGLYGLEKIIVNFLLKKVHAFIVLTEDMKNKMKKHF
jgi:hypothetical protein